MTPRTPLNLISPHNSISLSPSTWNFLPPGFCKLNFDGASKGNPGPIIFGVVIRDGACQLEYLMEGYLRHDTSNSVELLGLIRGIQLASDLNLTHLIIEGDSKIIISLVAKIINGTDPEKITPSWHLMGPLNNLQSLLHPSLTLISSHIRREANKVTDKLSNEGVTSQT